MISVRHVIWALRTGGAEMALLRLIDATRDPIPDQMICVVRSGGSLSIAFEELGVPIVHFRMNPIAALSAAKGGGLDQRCLAPARIVQGWMYYGNLLALGAKVGSARPACRVVWNVRHSLSWLESETWRIRAAIRLGALLSPRADAIIYNSRFAARQHEAYGFDSTRTIVVPNGIDCGQFQPSGAASQRLREMFGIAGDVPIVGLVARYHPIKAHAVLIEAMGKIVASGRRAHLLLIGPGIDMRNHALTSAIHAAGIFPHVSLAGERQDVPELLPGVDIACLASHSEAWPNFLGEAMACGVPCVSTDVGDASEIVGDTGQIVQPNDVDALVAGLTSILDSSPERRRILAEAARRRIRQEFDMSLVARRYEAVYDTLCTKGHWQ